MTKKRFVPCVLIALALAVNYPHLARLVGKPDAVSVDVAGAQDPPVDDEVTPGTSPAPRAAIFAPILPADDLADPFVRRPDDADTAGAPAEHTLLPQVTMILRTAGSRRAVIDRDTVGVGDKTAAGTVVAIEPDHVLVQTPAGATQRLALPVAVPARAATDSKGSNGTKVQKEDKQ